VSKKPYRANVKPPGKCIFCAGPGLSKEHFWSSWTAQFLPSYPENEHVEHLATFTEKTKLAKPTKVQARQGQAWTKKIRVVCRNCNHGWMSDLEQAAKPILIPLIIGQPTELNATSEMVLARWVTMKIMVAEHNAGAVVTPFDARADFKATLKIPENFRVWLAQCGVGGFETGFYRHTSTLTLPTDKPPTHSNVQSVTFGIGQLLVHVLTTPPDLPLYSLETDNGFVEQLFPYVRPIHWPLHKRLTFGAANEIAHMLDRVIERPNILWKPRPSP
jgi:hypothetical protein